MEVKIPEYSGPQILENNIRCENLKLVKAEKSLQYPLKEDNTVKSVLSANIQNYFTGR
jgi:hypothetical protein